MPKYLLYKMTHDSGFAPNPFWGYLTLAVCTPNHMKANLKKGDWVIGVEGKQLAYKRRKAGCNLDVEQSLIYIARVDEILSLDEYFKDERFESKKYQKNSKDWRKCVGDNVYYIEDGKWKWLRGHKHDNENAEFFYLDNLDKLLKDKRAKNKYGDILKDVKGNRVYISRKFLYFGDKGIEFDKHFSECLPSRQGIKYCPEQYTNKLNDYINSLFAKYGKNKVLGNPIEYCIEYRKK